MNLTRTFSLPGLLGVAHAVSDGSAGWLMATLAGRLSLAEVSALTLAYNALAFAAQPAVGLYLDRTRQPQRAVFVSLGLMALALLVVDQPLLAVVVAGLASAVFHVGGGMLAIGVSRDRATGLGMFAAPGVIGLACGGALAAAGASALVWLILLLAMFGSLRLWARSVTLDQSEPKVATLADRDLIVMAILVAIAVRSAVWSAFEWVLVGNTPMLLAAALAAGSGKLVGGALADRLGWRAWTMGALAVAALLLAIGPNGGGLFLLGLALLQSVTPVTLAALAQVLPGRSGLAAGLSLGLAIALGGLFVFAGLGAALTSPPLSLSLVVVSGAVLVWVLNRQPVIRPQV